MNRESSFDARLTAWLAEDALRVEMPQRVITNTIEGTRAIHQARAPWMWRGRTSPTSFRLAIVLVALAALLARGRLGRLIGRPLATPSPSPNATAPAVPTSSPGGVAPVIGLPVASPSPASTARRRRSGRCGQTAPSCAS
jgi:hypothetical protein